MTKTKNHVYFTAMNAEVVVLSVWGANRGRSRGSDASMNARTQLHRPARATINVRLKSAISPTCVETPHWSQMSWI